MPRPTQNQDDPSFWAPGTLTLEDLQSASEQVILHPTPSSDPNDPLNWTPRRKTVNFTLVCFYVLMTFVQLDVGFTSWDQYQDELGFSIDFLNAAAAINYAGLAVGCIFLVPLVHKYGRRPMYIFSTLLQLVSCVWLGATQTRGDMIGSNLLSGISGAISETIVQITIADLFFVHHHGAMNGWYLFATFAGAYLGPVASGYIVNSQGWRWVWWWCVIIFSVNLVMIVLFFDESKYVSIIQGQPGPRPIAAIASNESGEAQCVSDGFDKLEAGIKQVASCDRTKETVSVGSHIDPTIPLKTRRQRLALITKTDGSMAGDFYQPLVLLFTFPAVAFIALTYGSLLAWFAVVVSVQATYLFNPPYNFSAIGVGLMNIAPFIGTIPAIWVGGYLNDKSIIWLARRNGGIYEPEMRLWMSIPMAFVTPAGILMFGLGLYYEAPWPLLAVGFGVFGFGLVVAGDIGLSYAMDCYHDVIGNALVGVVFSRNVISVLVLFALTPWIDAMGLRNLHVMIAKDGSPTADTS
ncbi:Major facilitator superfamily transporter [Cordyceps fumosorosea ARSEF 2679]|uniref:Major facilitator superfamily transporter n=1 Tax=Cordyceps fumosorosea (strain ARSEF 2679) TaxID=1081104 RepID=A0A167UB94_CORFA|nr:Major facilitator superfamily transporter [Cordyceps fumosorosea ARSEF 2679]OAA61408.1 Major facilitator superfamily transporter [Cordyceps fumosorosea ARSEF 2679]